MNRIFTVTLNPAVDRELAVPEIKYDCVLRASSHRVDYGGKGFNVSRMLKSLGKSSVAIGFTGGKSGERLEEGLKSLGIETDFVRISGETRTNVSFVSENHDHYIKVNEPGPFISDLEQQAMLNKINTLCQPGDWWVLAGSLPPGSKPDFYSQLIVVIQNAGAQVILDASGEALSLGCQAGPFMIKPNETELGKLTEMPTDSTAQILEAVLTLLPLGISNVLVSMGARGAVLINGKDAWLIGSPRIEESNPIGAGDSMVGGLVWGLSQGFEMAEAARWGVACGAAAASLSGTAVGTLAQVKRLWSHAVVKKLIP